MIYEFSNFVDNYSNADGQAKKRMAVTQFSKLLGQSPKVVEVAIADADIPVPVNASRQQMIRIIQNNADNKKLKAHLGTLVYVQALAEGENLNLFGKKEDGTPRAGSQLFSKIGGLFKKKNTGTDGQTTGTEKRGFFKKLFGRKTDPTTGEKIKGSSRLSQFFKKNGNNMLQVGGDILAGVSTNQGSQDANTQSNYYAQQGGVPNQAGMGGGRGNKTILFIVLGLVAVGGVIYFVRKK